MADTDTLVPLRDGPWTGMVDSIAPTSKIKGKYYYGQNIYPLSPELGDGIVGRPGVRVMGGQGGAVGVRRVQGIYQFTKKDGTEYTIRVVGGKFYTLNWGTEIWTEVLTAANLAGAAITLDTTARVYFATFSDKLLVSDGVNTPWLWDGTTGAGLTKLVNAPVFYGQPTVYYARVFGIKASDRVTFVWSQTDDATTGYEAGGFNNAWTLTQADPNRLFRLIGTNDALYVLRARGGTTVTGSVQSNFASAATRDALSATIGTSSPAAVILDDTNIVVLDSDNHVQCLRNGAVSFEPAWAPMRNTTKRLPATEADLAKAMAVNFTPAGLALIAVPTVAAGECTEMLVYDIKSDAPIPIGVWLGWEMTALAMVKNANGKPYLLHGDTQGYVYLHGDPESQTDPWDDFLVGGTVAIEHILEQQPIGWSAKDEKIFDRVDATVRALSTMTLELSIISPRGRTLAPQAAVVQPSALGWDTGLFDDVLTVFDPDISDTEEVHAEFGIDETARWLKLRWRHATVGEQFGMIATEITAFGSDDDPEVP